MRFNVALSSCRKCGQPLVNAALTGGFCARCLIAPLATEAITKATQSPFSASSTPTNVTPASPLIGCQIGSYELLEKIAEGGMGIVYKARDSRVHRVVALKMVLFAKHGGTRSLKRFRVEAESVAALDHPHIVPIYEVGETEGQPYFTMKFIEGESLATRLMDFHKDLRAGARLLATVACAIHHAHQRGVLHRDLKPANILLDQKGDPFVTDFGLALRFEEGQDLTHTGAIMGTPSYMSPEQAAGDIRQLTTAADIYSLGAMLYHIITGRPPFLAETALETLRLVQDQDPAYPSALNPLVGGDLETICLKCLEKDPRKRYQSALEFGEELERWLAHETIIARRATPAERVSKWVRRKPLVAALVGAVVLTLATGIAGVFYQWQRAEIRGDAEKVARGEAEKAYRSTAALLTGIELEKADLLFSQGNTSAGLAYFARVLRREPAQGIAAERVMSFLSRQAVPLAELTVAGENIRVIDSALSPDQQRVVLALDLEEDNVRILDLTGTNSPLLSATHHFAMPRLGLGRDGSNASRRFAGMSDGPRPPMLDDPLLRLVNDTANVASLEVPHERRFRPINVSFSQDSQRVITTSPSGKTRVWDSQTATPVWPFMEDSPPVREVKFMADNRLMAMILPRGVVALWDVEKEAQLSSFLIPGQLRQSFFNVDGSRLLALTDEGTQLWDVQKGEVISRFKDPADASSLMAWNEEYQVMAITSAGKVTLRKLTGEPAEALECVQPVAVAGLTFSPDGQTLATIGADWQLRLWESDTGKILGSPLRHPQAILGMNFSHSGKSIVTLCRDNMVRLWDVTTGQQICKPIAPQALALSAHFTLDDKGLLILCRDGAVQRYQVANPPPTDRGLTNAEHIITGGFNPRSGQVFTAGQDGRLRFWDTQTGQLSSTSISNQYAIVQVAFSPAGERLLTVDSERRVVVWDVSSGKPLTPPMDHSIPVFSARFSADGESVIVLTKLGLGQIWSARNGQAASPSYNSPLSDYSVLSPDGKVVLADTGIARAGGLFDLQTGERVGAYLKHAEILGRGNFSPDGKKVITASHDNTARIWDVQTAKPLTDSLRHSGSVYYAVFSPDGRQAVTVSEDKTARLWDTTDGAALSHTLLHPASVRLAEFSRDGRRLLTMADDFSVHLWDTRLGLRIADPLSHTSKIITAHFSPDGQSVLTVAEKSGVRLWSVPLLPTPAPPWLADLAEMIGGSHIDDKGLTQPASGQTMARLRKEIAANPGAAFYTERLAWLLREAAAESGK